MDREADVLQQRVEPGAFHRRHRQALERVGGQEQEGIEAQCHEALHRQRRAHGAFGQALLEGCQQTARRGQHADPQQHRALVVTPGAGELVDQRLHRMRIGRHQLDRQVGDGEGIEQQEEGQHRQERLHDRGRAGVDRQRRGFAFGNAQGHRARDHLQHRQRRSEPQGGKSDFGNHCSAPHLVPCA